MKKALSLLLALMMCLSLAACGGNETAENPYEKYAKYEELFVYLEAGDWDNANAYIQNYFGMTDDVPVDTGTTPSETTTPEPIYETIEITTDNWQEYFEMSEVFKWNEDAFGDTTGVYICNYLCIKEDYADKVVAIDVAIELSTTSLYRYFDIDLATKYLAYSNVADIEENDSPKSYVLEPRSWRNETRMEVRSLELYEGDLIQDSTENLINAKIDRTGKRCLAILEELAVLRIQGTIEIQTN